MFIRKAIIFFVLTGISLFSVFAITNLFEGGESSNSIADQITQNITREINVIESEADRLKVSVEETVWDGVSHSFFLMDKNTVIRWNQNEFLPDPNLIDDDFEIKLLRISRGAFIVKKWKLDSQRFLLSVVDLQQKYFITNRYLSPTWNARIFSGLEVEILDSSSTEGYPIFYKGTVLFKVQFPPSTLEQNSVERFGTLVLGCITLVLFLIALYFWVLEFHTKSKYGQAFTILLIGMILLRANMTLFNFPSAFTKSFIFDPLLFASSSLNPSIADLFFNATVVLLLAAYFFYTFYKWKWIKKVSHLTLTVRFLLTLSSLFVAFFSMLFPFLFFETISHNSGISLDISNSVSFDSIRILAFLSILLGSVSCFLFCHAFIKLSILFARRSHAIFIAALLTAACSFLVYYKIAEKDYLISLGAGFVYFLLVYLTGLDGHLKRISHGTFIYLFLAIAVLAAQGSFSVRRFVEEKKRQDQIRFGNKFLVDRDILGEYLLNEAVQNISKDQFVQSRMSIPFLSKSGVRQKVSQFYLNAYFDRYDVKVYLYNASGESHDELTKMNFADLVKTFQHDANKTGYAGIYFIESATQESAKRYLAIVPIEHYASSQFRNQNSGPAGYVVLDLALKKLIPQNVFPELLVDNQFINYFKNTDFSYAFFREAQLISSSGTFNYEQNFTNEFLESSQLFSEGLSVGEFMHIGMQDELGKVAVVSAKVFTNFDLFANFAFLFVIGLCFVLFLLILYAAVLWIRGERLNYAARIQVYVYLAFLLPLVAVSITTLSLISRSEERELQEEYLDKSKVIGSRLSLDLGAYLQNNVDPNAEFEDQLLTLAKLANLDASVFSKTGNLIASSQPLIYQNQLAPTLLDREAWVRIVEGKENAFIKNDDIGKLNFNISYSPLKSATTGELIGILSIPFFDSAHSLEKTKINVLTNILVIFIIVFLLFSFISFFIVNWLTFPLRLITRTLKKTTFSEENVPLTWNSNDEIGLMVNEYNRMLENLEISKVELARSQKESAWREIAKQIAHEINNPLTPMKLTLQRMDLAQLKGTLDKENTKKSLQTLLKQVEILSQIASSFSAFARMPSPVLQKMDVYIVLKRVADLYGNDASVSIHFPHSESVYILGDEQLLTRIFSNITLNAQQSVEEGDLVKIDIVIKKEGDFCVTSISDNGKGIDQELAEKVFLPHFSTKKSGSGIGLAIAKQGIELSGGTIWFESKAGSGTTFYIRLPLYKEK
ncbi:MAG: hypothetical protein JJE09_10210 [Bacteroidia bacterium]|nr:hypothetical protein [Bacteroidia bacterium]